MSLRLLDFFARDQLHLFIHPEYLVLMRIKGAQEVVKKQVLQLDLALESYKEMNGWQSVLSLLQAKLTEDEWGNGSTHIVISNHFVRYTCIPWSAELNNREEELAYLKHSFVKRYGDAAKLWSLRMTTPDFQQPALASGISDMFLQQLQSCFSHTGLKVTTIQPHLMFALNQSLTEIGEYSVCFVMVERGRVCIAIIQNGILQSVTEYATETDIASQVETIIKRESIMLNIDTEDWPMLYWSDLPNIGTSFTRKAVINVTNPYWQRDITNFGHSHTIGNFGVEKYENN